MTGPYWIDNNDKSYLFPPVELALDTPNGLLAVGGDLTPERIVAAYRQGIFPWFNEDQPILWWSPDPRAVLFPHALCLSRSLKKTIRQAKFDISFDHDFASIIDGCAAPRTDEPGTWITQEMRDAYIELHRQGIAHSVEARLDGQLVGGLYGLAIGRCFFGESMFSRVTDASKVAFAYLVAQLKTWDYELIDCQVSSKHLESLGARDIPRQAFITLLARATDITPNKEQWHQSTPRSPLEIYQDGPQ